MKLDNHSKVLFLLSNEVLIEDGFFVFLETLDYKVRNFEIDEADVRIYVDVSIQKDLLQYQRNNERKQYKRVKGIIDILKVLQLYEELDTIEFIDFKPFITLKESHPDYQLVFITQLQSNALKFHLLDEDNHFVVEKLNGIEFEPYIFPKKVQKSTARTPDEQPILTPSFEPTMVSSKIPDTFEKAFYLKHKKYLSITEDVDLNYVYSEKFGYLKLEKNDVMFGGEGKIYRTYENLLVKVYSEEERRYELVKKIQRMIDLDLRNKFIVWPKDIVYNNNEFIGYAMEEIKDAQGLDMYRIYSFLNLSYTERFQICIDLLKRTQYLHDKGILIGDLKFDNIMLTRKTKELYIIDSASFQIEDYSCAVFNADYTHENLKGKNLREVLRTIEEEFFPINKILFEVLMGKGPFYDFKTGEVGSDVERQFHFPLEVTDNITNRNNPLFFWSHADERLRHVFYNYFVNNIITEVPEWIDLLEDILYKGAK